MAYRLLITFLTTILWYSGIGQDKIYTTDGRILEVKIIDTDGPKVIYKEFGVTEAPLRNFDKKLIDFIKYENGRILRFESSETEKESVAANPDLAFLRRKYEQSLSSSRFWNGAMITGSVVAIVGLIGAQGEDADIDTAYAVAGAATVVALAGAFLEGFYKGRAQHFQQRINALSFSLGHSPRVRISQKHAHKQISMGLILTF